MKWLILLVALARASDHEPQGFATPGGTNFCQGVTLHGGGKHDVVSAAKLGSNCARVRIPWLVVQREPIRRSELCSTDSPAMLRNRCDHQNVGPDAANVRRACWEAETKGKLQFVEIDELVYAVADPKFKLVALLGEGTSWSLPVVEDDVSTGDAARVRPLDVNIEGMSCYLNNLYVYARVVVMRYKNVIKHWQLENGLNSAAVHAKYYGWRSRARGGIDHWSQKDFQDSVLATLIAAVRDSNDPSLRVSTGLDIDIPKQALNALGLTSQRSDSEAGTQWLNAGLDYLGVNSYPCRFSGAFNGGEGCGQQVGRRVVRLQEALESVALEPPEIVVMSTGASVCRTQHQVTEQDAEAEQAAFVRNAYKSAVAGQVSGFFYVGTHASLEPHVKTLKHITHPLWSLTDYGILSRHEQETNRLVYRALGGAIEREDYTGISNWRDSGADMTEPGLAGLIGPLGLKDCPGVETDVDWALTRDEGSLRFAFEALGKMYKEEPPLTRELLDETHVIEKEIGSRYH